MRLEKAIELLKGYKESIETNFSHPERLEPYEAYKLAIQALEKQKAKKLIHKIDDWTNAPRCGRCQRLIKGGYKHEYCHACGQKYTKEKEE